MRNRTLRERAERGQALVILAAAFIGLAAFVGLTVDAGILFSSVGHLRRATDAAALAAANHFREGWDPPDLSAEALEMLKLNGLDSAEATAKICDLTGTFPAFHDASLCPDPGEPYSKTVRVVAAMDVNFAFLPIIGFKSTTIRANAESQAASIDMVLALDVSNSMSIDLCYDKKDNDGDVPEVKDECAETTDPDDTGSNTIFDDDVETCVNETLDTPGYPTNKRLNNRDTCHPFEEVRDAAHKLVDRMYFPYDRLSIVTFGRLPKMWLELDDTDSLPPGCSPTDPKGCAHLVLDQIQVEPDPLPNPDLCEQAKYSNQKPRGCTSTNIGDGLLWAGGRFCVDDNPKNDNCDRVEMREEAVWIVILLTDGSANAAIGPGKDPGGPPDFNFSNWICPVNTYDATPEPRSIPTPSVEEPSAPWCKDSSSATRHVKGDANYYDVDDYARDKADFVGCPGPGIAPPPGCPADGGVGAVIFAIGLGANVTDSPNDPDEPRAGEILLRYIAAVGVDGDPSTDVFCGGVASEVSCGNYFYAPEGDDLVAVFEEIASRIFTRITH